MLHFSQDLETYGTSAIKILKFFLGSEVKLSVCSRYEGASFIVVKSLKDARRCAFLGELDSEEESDENSDSDEFEFVKDNRPTEPTPTPTSGTSEMTTPSPTATASKEIMTK